MHRSARRPGAFLAVAGMAGFATARWSSACPATRPANAVSCSPDALFGRPTCARRRTARPRTVARLTRVGHLMASGPKRSGALRRVNVPQQNVNLYHRTSRSIAPSNWAVSHAGLIDVSDRACTSTPRSASVRHEATERRVRAPSRPAVRRMSGDRGRRAGARAARIDSARKPVKNLRLDRPPHGRNSRARSSAPGGPAARRRESRASRRCRWPSPCRGRPGRTR